MHQNDHKPQPEPDAQTLRAILACCGDDLASFMDRTPPPGPPVPIRRFVRHASLPILHGLLIDVLAAMHRRRTKK